MKDCCKNNINFKPNGPTTLYCSECGTKHEDYMNGLTSKDYSELLLFDTKQALSKNIYMKSNAQSGIGERQISFIKYELDEARINNHDNELTIRMFIESSFISVQINKDQKQEQFRRTNFKHSKQNNYSRKYGSGQSFDIPLIKLKSKTIDEIRKIITNVIKSPFFRESTEKEFLNAREHFDKLNESTIELINLLYVPHK